MQNLDALLGWLAARLVEPSTYLGLSTILVLLHLGAPPGLTQSITYIGMGIGGVLGIILKEKGIAVPPQLPVNPSPVNVT